jgi:cytoskeletal protein RodZ
MTETPAPESQPAHATLGEALRAAREAKGLDLQTVADRTRIRRAYLEAFEQNAVDDFPSSVYARNFVRLYAREVGLPETKALSLLGALTGAASAPATLEGRDLDGRDDDAADVPTVQRIGRTPPPRKPRTGKPLKLPTGLLLTAFLLAVVVGGGLWGVNALFSNATAPQNPGQAVTEQGATADATAEPDVTTGPDATTNTAPGDAEPTAENTAQSEGGDLLAAPSLTGPNGLPSEVRINVTTNPPGANVSVDAFPLPGTTPIENAPITARPVRTLTVSLDGYQDIVRDEVFTEDRSFSFDLEPVPAAEAPSDNANASSSASSGNELRLVVRERSWLEAYAGLERGEGERLAYTTAQPGSEYEFELPVYIWLGNAGGVDVFLNGEPVDAIGPNGGVTGAAFPVE